MRQDTKQDIRGYSVKNFDFICHNEKGEIFLIDLKGSSGNVEDTKVSENDIKSLEKLQNLYGKNVKAMFIFFWLKDTKLERDFFKQNFKIKSILLDDFKKKMRSQGSWGAVKYFRCSKNDLKDIWYFIPKLRI
jgi:hypothetical protein